MSAPAHLRYTRNHYWIRLDGQQAIIGLTEQGIAELGMILFVELPERGALLKQGDFIGSAETIDGEHDLFAPISGKVTSVNMLLERAVLPLHESPYDKGWLIALQWDTELELEQLWDEESYEREFPQQ